MVNGIKQSKKFNGVAHSESSHLTLILFKRLLEEGYIRQPIIKDLFARNQLKSLEMWNELPLVAHIVNPQEQVKKAEKIAFVVNSKVVAGEESKA